MALVLMAAIAQTFISCADVDETSNNSNVNQEATLRFQVSDAQYVVDDGISKSHDMSSASALDKRLAALRLVPANLAMERLDVRDSKVPGLCVVSTTIAGVNPISGGEIGLTRGTVVTTATLPNFNVTGLKGLNQSGINELWFENKETRKNGEMTDAPRWSKDRPWAKFFAVSPRTVVMKNTDAPYVDFEVDADAAKQQDLLAACSDAVHYDVPGTAPLTPLTFRHALAAIRFKVGPNQLSKHTITKIEIEGALCKGRYTLPTTSGENGTWSNLSEPRTCVLGDISIDTKQDINHLLTGNGDNYTFFMIPQETQNITIKIYCDGKTTPFAKFNGKKPWVAGTTREYALQGSNKPWEYVFTVKKTDQFAEYNDMETSGYTITSYRQIGNKQKPVAWRIVGWDTNGDNKFDETKPDWITKIKDEGVGGTDAENCVAGLRFDAKPVLTGMEKTMRANQPKGSLDKPYNLANQTDGGDLVENTANCYVVSAPGYYRIPLVYGNAISGTKENKSAYTSKYDVFHYLKVFLDHADKPIVSPYINEQNKNDEAAVSAQLVWADAKGLVSDLRLARGANASSDFLTFRVDKESLRNGNAVVAVKNQRGVIMWSWHLWFTKADALKPIPCVNHEGKTYSLMSEPVGTKYIQYETTYGDEREVKFKVQQVDGKGSPKDNLSAIITITQEGAFAPYVFTTQYQSGRKDALPGTSKVQEGNFGFAQRNVSIGVSIQNPGVMYSSNGKWCEKGWDNLWSSNHKRGNDNNIDTWAIDIDKTIYDPSPVGYKMPPVGAYSGFTTTGKSTSEIAEINSTRVIGNGWHFYTDATKKNTVYFPASGYLWTDDGVLESVGIVGYYWYAPRYYGHGHSFSFSFYRGQRNISMRADDGVGLTCAIHPVAE